MVSRHPVTIIKNMSKHMSKEIKKNESHPYLLDMPPEILRSEIAKFTKKSLALVSLALTCKSFYEFLKKSEEYHRQQYKMQVSNHRFRIKPPSFFNSFVEKFSPIKYTPRIDLVAMFNQRKDQVHTVFKSSDDNVAFILWAAERGHFDIVKWWYVRLPSEAERQKVSDNEHFLDYIFDSRDLKTLDYFFAEMRPERRHMILSSQIRCTELLITAMSKGFLEIEIVKWCEKERMLPRKKSELQVLLTGAVANGQLEISKFLFEKLSNECKPEDLFEILRVQVDRGDLEVFQWFYPLFLCLFGGLDLSKFSISESGKDILAQRLEELS